MRDIFERTALNHHFELQAARLHREGKIRVPIYLSLGTEHIPPSVLAGIGCQPALNRTSVGVGSPSTPDTASVPKEWRFFGQHRVHSWALTLGLDPLSLFKELLGHESGCNGGYGGSASVSIPSRMYGHSGLLGDQAAIGVGYAVASRTPTVVVLGDAAVEEDYVLASFGYAADKRAPVLFIVEDNGLSIKTPKRERRKWRIGPVAASFGLRCQEVQDRPDNIIHAIDYLRPLLPALINVQCCRLASHAGSTISPPGPEDWNRYELMLRQAGADGEEADRKARDRMFLLAEQALAETSST